MARNADDLVVGVGADLKSLERELKKAGVIAGKAVDDIEDRFARANPQIGAGLKAGIAGLAAGLAAGLIASLAEANKSLLEMDKTATKAAISLRDLQTIQLAGGRVGISGDDINKGVVSLATALNQARREENELTKFLDANNQKWKDREGNVIGVNEALTIAADLISRASTELDKIDIAKKLSIPENLIPLLEKGAGEFLTMRNNAAAAGQIIDEAIIQKAKDFDEQWTRVVANVTAQWKAGVVMMASDWYDTAVSIIARARQIGGEIRAAVDPRGAARSAGAAVGQMLGDAKANPFGTLPTQFNTNTDAELQRQLNARYKQTTTIPTKKDTGGGGGGGNDFDQREAQVERYIESLLRAQRVLEAEQATIGKSNAERAKAIELARIGEVTDAGQLKRISEIVEKNEELRRSIEAQKRAREGVNEAANFAGNQLVDALDQAIFQGKELTDVMRGVAQAIAKAALQALLLGQGPLAGLLGMSSGTSAPGGLIGAFLPGRASGGPVNKGRPYMVGEQGRELFVPQTPGRIIPNSALRGGGGMSFAPTYQIDARGSQMGEAQFRAILAENNRLMMRNLPQAFAAQQRRFV